MSKWESIKYAAGEVRAVFAFLLGIFACYVVGWIIEATFWPGLQQLLEVPQNALAIIATRTLVGAVLVGSIYLAYTILDLFFIEPTRTFVCAYKEHQSRYNR
jgi:cytochrome b subunit of formate dehydrogenase